MEHMKKLVHVAALIAAGAVVYVYVVPHLMNMYHGSDYDNVKVQTYYKDGNGTHKVHTGHRGGAQPE